MFFDGIGFFELSVFEITSFNLRIITRMKANKDVLFLIQGFASKYLILVILTENPEAR